MPERSCGSVKEFAFRMKISPGIVTRYRRKMHPVREHWPERIALIRAIPRWCFEVRRRDRIARMILGLADGLEGRVFAVFCDPELLVSNDPVEMVRFAREQRGVLTICVTDVLRKTRRNA